MAQGHRARLRQRLEYEEIDHIPEYVVLEMILQGTIQRRDTCALARELLAKFGSLAQVIDAPLSALMEIPGIGENAAMQIKLIPAFYRKYQLSKRENTHRFTDLETVSAYLRDQFIGYRTEIVFALCMDASCKLLRCVKIDEGEVGAVSISVRRILQAALDCDASRVIVAHNHPGGNATPSKEDLETTGTLMQALCASGIQLDDHIIVAEDDVFSFAQNGKLKGAE